ncbi:MAG: phospholipase D-like domain-containing protein [Bdellovibrionia bacterium]
MAPVRLSRLLLVLLCALGTPGAYAQLSPQHIELQWHQLENKYAETESAGEFVPTPPVPFQASAKLAGDPQTAFLAKILMIRAAKSTIDIATYEFLEEAASYAVLCELKHALDRGVSVRILADSVASANLVHPSLKALIALQKHNKSVRRQTGNLSVKLFNSVTDWRTKVQGAWATVRNMFTPPDWDINVPKNWINRRLHDKLMLIDGQRTFDALVMVGGRNINGKAHGVPHVDVHTYLDMDILLKSFEGAELGPQTYSYFEKLFYHIGNRKLEPNFWGDVRMAFSFPDQQKKILTGMDDLFRMNPALKTKLESMERENYLAWGFSGGKTELVHEIQNIVARDWLTGWILEDPANRNPNGSSISKVFANYLRKAKKSVVVVSPYLFLNEREGDRILEWLLADRTRKLTLVTNSNLTIDNILAQIITDHGTVDKILKSRKWEAVVGQVRIYQYGKLDDRRFGGQEMYGLMHAKYAVIDDQIAIVTTSNSDPRSRIWNSEVGYITHNAPIAAQLNAFTDYIISRSYLWGTNDWLVVKYMTPTLVPALLQPILYQIMEISKFVNLM